MVERGSMDQIERLLEIVTTYRKHGWSLKRLLMTAETRASGAELEQTLFADAEIELSPIDALWFYRPSHEQREAAKPGNCDSWATLPMHSLKLSRAMNRRSSAQNFASRWKPGCASM